MPLDHQKQTVSDFTINHEAIKPLLGRHDEAAAFLKAASHEGRLMILCHLLAGERSVTELERLLGQRQAAVSQQLARLRLEGLVSTRRDGKAIYYAVHDPKVQQLVQFLGSIFARDERA